MPDQFGRPGRRADLARLLHTTLIERGMAPLDGAALAIIDEKIAQVATDLGISRAAALRQLDDHLVVALATSVADNWHASKLADHAAGDFVVPVAAADAAQLVMGLAMAVGQLVREACGELPASAGEPLDALCELGAALRAATEPHQRLQADVTLEALSIAQRSLQRVAAGVADGTVPVVIADANRPQFAAQLVADAELAARLQP
jgi:hypothetical protein